MPTQASYDEAICQMMELRNVTINLIDCAEAGVIPDNMAIQHARGKLQELACDRQPSTLQAPRDHRETREEIREEIRLAIREDRLSLARHIRNATPSKHAFTNFGTEGEEAVRDFGNNLAKSLEDSCK